MRQPYLVLQVCLNGHLLKEHFRGELDKLHQTTIRGLEQFCPQCGSKTIAHCQSCHREIRDESLDSILSAIPTPIHLPSFCTGCGSPYPWTQQKIDAVFGLIDEAETDPQEAQKLKGSLPSIITETPSTQLAIVRFKGFLNKAIPPVKDGLIKIFIDILDSAMLRHLGLK
jgi:hypothetical protein